MAFGEGFGEGFAGKPTVGVPRFRKPAIVPIPLHVDIQIKTTVRRSETIRARIDAQIRRPSRALIQVDMLSRVRASWRLRPSITVRKPESVRASISSPIRHSEFIRITSLSAGEATPGELLETYEAYQMSKIAEVPA